MNEQIKSPDANQSSRYMMDPDNIVEDSFNDWIWLNRDSI